MTVRDPPEEAVSAGASVLMPHVPEDVAPALAVQVWRAMCAAVDLVSAARVRSRGRPLSDSASYEMALAEVRAGASPGSMRKKYGLSGSVTARLKRERDGV